MKFDEVYARISKSMKDHGILMKEKYTTEELRAIAIDTTLSMFFVNTYLTHKSMEQYRNEYMKEL